MSQTSPGAADCSSKATSRPLSSFSRDKEYVAPPQVPRTEASSSPANAAQEPRPTRVTTTTVREAMTIFVMLGLLMEGSSLGAADDDCSS